MHTDIPLARRDIIALRLEQGEGAVATTLAQEFGVSEDAIRRDLRALAAAGKCRRVYGGALPLLPVSPASSGMAERMEEGAGRKAALARTAAALVQKHELVFLDNGSTNLAIVRFLAQDMDLTIATNSVHIAIEVLKRSDMRLTMVGGMVDPGVGGCIDAHALAHVAMLNIDRCFLGACAVSASSGIAAFDPADAAFKRAVMAASAYVAVLATSAKLETRAPHRVAAVGDVDRIIVEHDAPAAIVASLTQAGALISPSFPESSIADR
jgi:DeoR/GlpR family transcriptional regulator of sugar metabolism